MQAAQLAHHLLQQPLEQLLQQQLPPSSLVNIQVCAFESSIINEGLATHVPA